MANIRELRGRIRSVNNIKQITRAMEMVATTKLRKYQDRAVQSRPYSQEIRTMVAHLAAVVGSHDGGFDLELLRAREGDRVAALVVTSDRGLCGAYNANVLNLARAFEAERPGTQVDWFVVGRKGFQYFERVGANIVDYFEDPPLEKVDFPAARAISNQLVDAFLAGTYRSVHVIYTAFESMVKYVPTDMKLLPIDPAELGDGQSLESHGDYLLEPSPEMIFERLIPKYLETIVYNALMESLTSEFASRRISMQNATDAATEMSGELSRLYNRARQEKITNELLEIVGGAEALKG